MGRLITLIAALVAGAMIAWMAQQPPKPALASAPATAFSAQRAMVDDRVIAAVPHPIGSDANHAVRDDLLRRMTELGLAPQVHRGTAAYASSRRKGLVLGGEVENLVGVLPGRDRSAPALALMAHYDSVPASSGAADDAAGVVSALEIVRAMQARGQPTRDVIVLFTDGEEAGLLGADAFFNRDPMARRIGFLINMEARGDAGRVQMFQTGAGNGQSVDLVRKTAQRPSSSSLTVFVYEHMPNDTDFTISKRAGVAGLNYAFTGRQFDYHSPTSIPATMDPGTLQDMGQQVLAVADAAAYAPTLPAKTADVVYCQVFGNLVLAYPPWVGWLVLAVAAGLIAFGAVRARRHEAFPWTDALRGLGACLFAVLGAVTLLHFARRATGVGFGYFEQRFLLAQVTRWEIALILLGLGVLLAAAAELARGRRLIALAPLAAGLASSLFGGFDPLGLGLGVAAAVVALAAYGRPISRAGAWSGALILGFILAVGLQVVAPLAGFILAWPLVLAALALAATDAATRKGIAPLVVIGVLAALGLGWIGGFVHAVYTSLDLVELLGLPLLLAALLVWPLAQPAEGAPPERLLGPALLIVGLALTAVVRFSDPYSARFPKLAFIQYYVDMDAGRAWRIRPLNDASPWSDAVMRTDGGKIGRLQEFMAPREAAPAHFTPLPAAQASLAKQADGSLRLHLAPPAGARTLVFQVTSNTPATLVGLGGVPSHVTMTAGQPLLGRWVAAPQGVDLVIQPAGPGRLDVEMEANIGAWPAGVAPLPKRPDTLMPFDVSDTAEVKTAARFTW